MIKPFLGEDVVENFINSLIKESKYFNNVEKIILKKNLWWIEYFENSLKCWIFDNVHVDSDDKQIVVISLKNENTPHMEIVMKDKSNHILN